MSRIFSCLMGIRLGIAPTWVFGGSITSRGGESSVRTSGITGPVERISTAGTPRAWTMRTPLIVGGGPKFWPVANAAGSRTASIVFLIRNAKRRGISSQEVGRNIITCEEGREGKAGVGRSASGVRLKAGNHTCRFFAIEVGD